MVLFTSSRNNQWILSVLLDVESFPSVNMSHTFGGELLSLTYLPEREFLWTRIFSPKQHVTMKVSLLDKGGTNFVKKVVNLLCGILSSIALYCAIILNSIKLMQRN